MKRTTGLLCLVLSLVILGVTGPSGSARAQGTINFGFLSSLSGPFTPWGVLVRDGMKMAIEEVNAKGGVLGKKLELVERDDRNNPSEGITAFQYLVEQKNVVAAGGVISSDVGLAVSRQAQALKVPLFLTMSGADQILTRESRYTFRTCLVPASENMDPIAALIKERKYTRVGAIVADYEWGHSLKRAIEKTIEPMRGVKVEIEVAPVSAKDFTPYLRKLQGLDPQVIVATGHPPGTPTITRQAIELGMKALVVGPWYPTAFMVKRVGTLMFGHYVDYSCVNFKSPAYRRLADKFYKKYKQLLDNNGFSGYTMVKMVANAIEKTKSDNPKVIADYIRKNKFVDPGYGWPLAYTEWGEMKGARPILYTYEKGNPGAIDPGADWRVKVLFRSPLIRPHVPTK